MDSEVTAEIVKASEQIEVLARPEGMAIERPPDQILEEARKAAGSLKDVLDKKKDKVMLNGQQYLEFEDWQTLGHFYGVTAGEDGDPEPVIIGEVKGFKASSFAYRHGKVISRATQYCMSDERNWQNKPLFQLSSMAQTRANAKVLRNVLAWVVVLAGYKPTPAEELDSVAKRQPNQPAQTAAPPGVISDAQQRRFWAIAKQAGWQESEVKDFLLREYHVEHTADIKRTDYEAICAALEAGGAH